MYLSTGEAIVRDCVFDVRRWTVPMFGSFVCRREHRFASLFIRGGNETKVVETRREPNYVATESDPVPAEGPKGVSRDDQGNGLAMGLASLHHRNH